MTVAAAHLHRRSHLLKPLILLLFTAIPLFLLFSFLRSSPSIITTTTVPAAGASLGSPALRVRREYASYDAYISHQLKKTLNPRLRDIWSTRDWNRKVTKFVEFFSDLRSSLDILSNSSSALCIGARMGQEVAALRFLGIRSAIGIDLVPNPPFVIKGDFHSHPFGNNSFDFEFSNVFDHALYPDKFAAEVERTLKPGGVAVIHVALKHRGDKYSANDLLGIDGLIELFKKSEVLRIRDVDGFGLDTEVVFRKKIEDPSHVSSSVRRKAAAEDS